MGLVFDNLNTATSPATGTRAINAEPINYNADWRVVDQKANEVTLVNLRSNLDQPMKLRAAWSEIPDIFKGSGVEPLDGSFNGNAKRKGVSVLMQLTGADSDENGVGPFPWSAHLVLKVPTGGGVDHENVLYILKSLLGHLFDTGLVDPASRIESILRGALTPVDL